MTDNLSKDFKNIFLAGIGAAAMTMEKSKEIIDVLVKKGELTVEQGKVLNEELKHNIKEKVKENVPVTIIKNDASANYLINHMDKMNKEELAAIRSKLDEIQRAENDGSQG